MRGERQLADFVEEQGAARGLDELAEMPLGRAREGAALVAEQGRFDEIVGNGAAIDRDERLRPPRAGTVNRPRDQLLADPGFALEQDRDVGRRRFLGGAQRRLHVRAARDHVLERQRAGAGALEPLELGLERIGGERVAQRNLQALGTRRLDHEIGGAGAHRRDHVVDAAVRGLHDDRNAEARLLEPRQNAEPVEIRHDQVEHDGIGLRGAGAEQALERGVAAFDRNRLVAEPADHGLEQPALHGIVVDDQDRFGHPDSLTPHYVPIRANVAAED